MAHVDQGRFIWHDLMSKEPAADRAFLEALVGYTVIERDMGEIGLYPMLMAGEAGAGGIVGMGADEPHPSHWIGYLVVSDLDASLATVQANGGTVLVPAFPIPDVGRTAVVADPKGAVFSPLEPATAETMVPQGDWSPGRFCWWELVTPDVAGAKDFYGKLVGWGSHELDMGGRPYWLWTKGEENNPGGLMDHPQGPNERAFWLFYILVADVDAATKRVAELGGKVISEPMDVPGQGRMSVISTPSGAMTALFKGSGG